MILPTIHRNGTSRSALLSDAEDAYDALQKAIKALYDAGPNGRDYYPQGPGALITAVAEHDSRIDRLRSVADEIETIMEHLAGNTP